MLSIEDIKPEAILEMCKRKAIANIAFGIALGYTPSMCAAFVLANYDSKYSIPDDGMGEYLNCGFHPCRETLKRPLKQTIDLINHRRWYEERFDQYKIPNVVKGKLDKEKHWADLKSFMQYHHFRVDFVQAVFEVVMVNATALENKQFD